MALHSMALHGRSLPTCLPRGGESCGLSKASCQQQHKLCSLYKYIMPCRTLSFDVSVYQIPLSQAELLDNLSGNDRQA